MNKALLCTCEDQSLDPWGSHRHWVGRVAGMQFQHAEGGDRASQSLAMLTHKGALLTDRPASVSEAENSRGRPQASTSGL